MNEVVIYLLKVMSIQLVLYAFYRVVLQYSKRHSLNRYFLLSALVLSFFIPLMDFSPSVEITETAAVPIINWISEPANSLNQIQLVPKTETTVLPWAQLLTWFYLLLTTALLVRFAVYLWALKRLEQDSEPLPMGWYTLFKTSRNHSFSFFRSVFMPQYLFGSGGFAEVLAHECAHVRRFHSMDRVLLDFLASLFWFNPFIYLYRNALIEIHEYEADEAVLSRYKDPLAYQEVLFSQLQPPQYARLVSHFNVQMIKKRIVMINKQNRMSAWVYALVVPVTLMVVFAFGQKEIPTPIDQVGSEIAAILTPNESVDSNIPSVLPFKEIEEIEVTSVFGMRIHPKTRKKQFHRGIDFRCPTGTELIATADGVVSEVRTQPKGYGKVIVISHADGFKTRYTHLSAFKVEKGENVTKGQVIALSGNSGASTGPHLHYEVIKDDEPVDPIPYISDYDFVKTRGSRGLFQYKPGKSIRKIIIDPGHGGLDNGTVAQGVNEKDLTLELAMRLTEHLKLAGKYEVVLTRNGDDQVFLKDRAQLSEGADLFLSLHVDAGLSNGSFVSPVFNDEGLFAEDSKAFASQLADEFKFLGRSADIGTSSNLFLLKKAACPAVLLNLGNLSNAADQKYLLSENGQKEIAEAIEAAITAL